MIKDHTLNQLPEIVDGQSWCCSDGCGICHPISSSHEYYRHEDLEGNLIESKTELIWVSNCCRKDLMLWDENKQDFVEWQYVEKNFAFQRS